MNAVAPSPEVSGLDHSWMVNLDSTYDPVHHTYRCALCGVAVRMVNVQWKKSPTLIVKESESSLVFCDLECRDCAVAILEDSRRLRETCTA